MRHSKTHNAQKKREREPDSLDAVRQVMEEEDRIRRREKLNLLEPPAVYIAFSILLFAILALRVWYLHLG